LKHLKEISFVFLKLGLIAFGGPAAHISMFEDEIVTKRKWMTHQHFLDLIGVTNLIPGPNSTEMAIHCGFHRAKVPGLIIAGLSFVFPAVLISGIFAYLYVQYGNLPVVQPFLYGIKPAVIIIILNAVYKLGSKFVIAAPSLKHKWNLILIAVIAALINFLGVNEILTILIGGIFGALFIYVSERSKSPNIISPFAFLLIFPFTQIIQETIKSDISLTKLFLVCLKIGAVLFGSGYVLVAYFDGELVQGLNWLTRKELLDAIAVGQFTPGPLLSSATFIGYKIAGISGALFSTLGIILPSFIFVLIVNPVVPRLRNSKIMSKFLDAVNVSALAVMFVVAVKLGMEILIARPSGQIDWRTTIIALLSAAAFLFFKKINSAYIVLGGAAIGYLLFLI
jgi:chromate transporter